MSLPHVTEIIGGCVCWHCGDRLVEDPRLTPADYPPAPDPGWRLHHDCAAELGLLTVPTREDITT